ncbi:MAG: ribokinase [Pseudomonadota bacterium]
MAGSIVILGIFVADTSYRATRMPRMGETILGEGFALGPGGKGSNQAVAAAMAGGNVTFVSRLGDDPFADMAEATWRNAGVKFQGDRDPSNYTGAAFIFVDSNTGDNAIIVAAGAASSISANDIEANAASIDVADIFVTQLEQPMGAAMAGLKRASDAGARTILNPAPAATLPEGMLALCDYVTPNETEASELTGVDVKTVDDARAAAKTLLDQGVRTGAIITLGEQGAFWTDGVDEVHAEGLNAGALVETTGAGDAFNGGLAVALSEGQDIQAALRFANATAAISVTRAGTAPAMPTRAEIEALIATL